MSEIPHLVNTFLALADDESPGTLHWVVCSTLHGLSPDALSPCALSPEALSPNGLRNMVY